MKQRKKKEQRGFRIKPNTILSLDHQLPFIKATRLSFTHEIGTDIFDFDLKSYFHNLELSYIQRPIHPDTDVYTLFDSAHDFPRYGEMDIIGYVDNNRQNQTVFLLPSPGHTLLVEHKGITIDVIYTSSTTVSDIVHFIYQFLCHVKVHDSDITTNNWKTYALRPLKTCCISKHNQNQTNSTTKHFVQNIMPPYLNGSCILSSILEDNAVVVFEKIMKNTDYSDSTSSSDIVSEDEIDFVVNMDNNSKVLVLVEIFTGEIYELFAFKDWTIAQLKREIFLTFSLRGATDPSTCLYLRRGLHEKILLSPTSLLRDVIELSDVAVILIERNPPPSLMLVSALSYDVPPPPVVLTVIVCTIDDRATYVTATTATFSVASTPELTPAHVAASFAGGLKTTTFILDKSPIPQKIGVLRYRTTPFPLDSSNTAFEIFS
ncbi:Myotubularin phosphatase domain-containing protein [Entamoeba marina]